MSTTRSTEGGPLPGTHADHRPGESGGNGRHELEKTDEDRRLYYVAATRAQFKLYLPFYLFKKEAPWLGPVCTLLSPALVEAFSRGYGDGDVLWLPSDHAAGDVTARVRPVTASPEQTIPETGAFEDLLIPESYEGRRIRVDSFSSLHQEKTRADDMSAEDISFQPSQEGKEADEVVGAWEMSVVPGEEPVDEIPGGTDVGLMFHGILEHMDYGVFISSGNQDKEPYRHLLEDTGTREIILGQMAAYRVDERWQEAICRILWNTLTAPIPPLGEAFTLSRLTPEDRLHEAAFLLRNTGSP